MSTNMWLGTAGMFLLLVAFLLGQLGRLSAQSGSYNMLNVIGGGLLCYYAITLGSVPFLLLEGVWTASALWKLVLLTRRAEADRRGP
jgi:hypothetical protein